VAGRPTFGDTQFANLHFPPIALVIEKLGMGEHQELCQSGIFDRMAEHRDYVKVFVRKLSFQCDCRVGTAVHEVIMTTVGGKFAEVYLAAQTFAIWAKRAGRSALIVVLILVVFLGIVSSGPHSTPLGSVALVLLFLGGLSAFLTPRLPPRFGLAARIGCCVPAFVAAFVVGVMVAGSDPGPGENAVAGGVIAGAMCAFFAGTWPAISQFGARNPSLLPKDVTTKIVDAAARKR